MFKSRQSYILLTSIIVCIVASSFYIYDFIIRVMPEAMIKMIMRDFNISAQGFGIYASFFFWGYVPMQIPCGILYDRFSARAILTIAVLCSALATVGTAYTHSFVLAGFCRFVMGFMTSFAFIGALVVGARWFRGQYFAFYTGLVQFLGCMGAIIGIAPVAYMSSMIGWRETTAWTGVIGLALAVLMWLIVRDPLHVRKKKKEHSLISLYSEAFSHAQTWWVALFGFAIWGPVTVFATTWGVSYFHDTLGLSKITAGEHITVVWWAIAVGGPLIGWLSKRFSTRRWPMLFCSVIGLLSSLGMLYGHVHSVWLLDLLMLGLGIGSSALVIAFGLVTDLQPPEAVGAVVGLVNMATIFAGITLLPLVGFLLQQHWDGQMFYGAPIYSLQSYQKALFSLPVCFLIAFIVTFLVKETHCQKFHEY